MIESKIELTSRLRREGRWPEASLYKDSVIKELRSTGMKKAEAGDEAWKRMAVEFPPLARAEEPSVQAAVLHVTSDADEDVDEDDGDLYGPEGLLDWLVDSFLTDTSQWQEEHGVTLTPDSLTGLMKRMGREIAFAWLMGARGDWPGTRLGDISIGASTIHLVFDDMSTMATDLLKERRRNRNEKALAHTTGGE